MTKGINANEITYISVPTDILTFKAIKTCQLGKELF